MAPNKNPATFTAVAPTTTKAALEAVALKLGGEIYGYDAKCIGGNLTLANHFATFMATARIHPSGAPANI
jgi:hypothetical protein